MVEGIDEHESLLVGSDITPNSLTKHLGITIYIEEIILQLESQADLLAKLIEIVSILSRSISQNGTNLQGTSQKHTGLEANHLDILLFLHIIAVLKLHIILLSLSNLKGCSSKELHHLGKMLIVALCHSLVSQHQHTVTREDSSIGIPLPVYSLMTTTEVSIIHQVVVQESIVVISLKSYRIHQNLLRIILKEIVSQEH